MCLDNLADFEVPDPGVGWKVFSVNEGNPHISSPYINSVYSVFYDKWLSESWYRYYQSQEVMVCYDKNWDSIIQHPIGFFIFLNKKDADFYSDVHSDKHIVLPVRFRHVVATGYESDKKVVVAKEMMILVEEP